MSKPRSTRASAPAIFSSTSFYSSSFDGTNTVEQVLKVTKDESGEKPKISFVRRVNNKTVVKSSDPKSIRKAIESGQMSLKKKTPSKAKGKKHADKPRGRARSERPTERRVS